MFRRIFMPNDKISAKKFKRKNAKPLQSHFKDNCHKVNWPQSQLATESIGEYANMLRLLHMEEAAPHPCTTAICT